MDDLEKLEQEIRVKLALATERRQSEQESSAHNMEGHERRREAYERAARQLMESVIRPRIEKVIAFFPNALLSPPEADTESQWCCRFQKTPDFPASTMLSLFVSSDIEIQNVIVTYDLEILPIYFQFQGHEQVTVPIADVFDDRIAAWIDAKLVEFVDAYLRTQTVDQYRLSTREAAVRPSPRNYRDTKRPGIRRGIGMAQSEISSHEDERRQLAMNRSEHDCQSQTASESRE
jgi:hypothetical protein